MKKLLLAGNWKSNKTIEEAREWLRQFITNSPIVLCAPFTALSTLKQEIQKRQLPISLGAQNVSKFDDGPVTGEISARMIRELADWVIIGHSSRRSNFNESDEDLAIKVDKAKAAGLQIIFCVPDANTSVPPSADVVAYEPVWAIGTGKTDTPENADEVCEKLKEKVGNAMVIYGGSVTDKNVRSFVEKPNIDGVLPGAASLDPKTFARLITSAFL